VRCLVVVAVAIFFGHRAHQITIRPGRRYADPPLLRHEDAARAPVAARVVHLTVAVVVEPVASLRGRVDIAHAGLPTVHAVHRSGTAHAVISGLAVATAARVAFVRLVVAVVVDPVADLLAVARSRAFGVRRAGRLLLAQALDEACAAAAATVAGSADRDAPPLEALVDLAVAVAVQPVAGLCRRADIAHAGLRAVHAV